ncbi:putative membrane protein [Neolewinella xylanilytica]|uniref:Putative membrane protein n=1 Tax=Neolewinella xylanilytica TaxID=1514080 RepID=A0A2S6I4F0_9BACT|nr:c-type cytochrome domain-containing protein [Neolewinella xylanilytica]PPK86055.1 putative membrane protein [Neolewinella xylanilytica]
MQLPVLADFSLFVGRFHPLVVHLPIGFLLLAVVLEWWPGRTARPAVRIAWTLGAVSATVAAVCGWLLAAESGGGDTLFWHRWLGVSVAALSMGGIFVTSRGGRLAKAYGIVVAAVLGLAGHLGGSLTHGEDYLYQHAPAVVQRLVGHAPDSSGYRDWSQTDLDSIALYATFLQPALEESCVRCHGAGEQRGGLRLDAPRFAYAGGDDGPLFVAGEPLRSHWVERVTLPRDDVKAMPPGGDPWTYTQVELLRYWIAEGADTNFVLDLNETPEDLKVLLRRDYGLDLRPRRFVETVEVLPLPEATMDDLRSMGWQLAVLQPDGGALEVQPKPGGRISGDDLRQLAALAAEQVVYLNLDDQPLDDADLAPLPRFTNLNRLRLNGTRLTNVTVELLAELAHLESLNLYRTRVDDGIFQHLPAYPSLERLYLWQTHASSEAAATFASSHPRITVETGVPAGAPPASQTK